MKNYIITLVCIPLICIAAKVRDLPQQIPVFATGKECTALPKLQYDKFNFEGMELDSARLVCGNKELAFRVRGNRTEGRDYSLFINADGQNIAHLAIVPGFTTKATDVKVEINKKEQSFTLLVPHRENKIMRLTAKPEGPCRIRLSWTNEPNDILAYIGKRFVDPKFERAEGRNWRGAKMIFGGEEWIQHSRDEILANLAPGKEEARIDKQCHGDFIMYDDEPLRRVGILFGDDNPYGAYEGLAPYKGGDHWFIGMLKNIGLTGSMIIDLTGAQEITKSVKPVNGIDFWEFNAFHYAAPPVRNEMRNPSFERGLQYWGFHGGGAHNDFSQDQDRFKIVEGGLFGKYCLHMRGVNMGTHSLRTFPMALTPGKQYTISAYVKNVSKYANAGFTMSLGNPSRGGTIKVHGPWGDNYLPESHFEIPATNGWTRVSRTFTADAFGLMIFISGNDLLVDGMQVEQGTKPTEFISAPIEGRLETHNRDNYLYYGDKGDMKYVLTGKGKGKVTLTISDIYGETLFRKDFKVDGDGELMLGKDRAMPFCGVFRVRADYKINGCKPYTEYSRFYVIKPLDNTHPSSRLFACFLHGDLNPRGETQMQRLMEMGFGSTTWMGPGSFRENNNQLVDVYKKYRFQNVISVCDGNTSIGNNAEFRKLTSYTPEHIKAVENAAINFIKDVPTEWMPYVSFWNEEESISTITVGDGSEYGKVQNAFYKAIKRANPAFKVTPTHGTSGWNKLRGQSAYDKYLANANKNGFKFDAVSVHPYGNIDGGTLGRVDADEEVQTMQRLLEKHGYNPTNTPIIMSECFNVPVDRIPPWGCDTNQDEYNWGKTGYDIGLREYQSACQLARMYLIYMKFWPQVKTVHCWMDPFIDAQFQPMSMGLALNTVAHFLPNPKYIGSARPVGGVRSYVWQEKERAVAAIWNINNDAENGRKPCTSLRIKFSQPVQFFDMMGNERRMTGDTLQLTSAPLYITADNAQQLLNDLKNAYSTDVASCLRVTFAPNTRGEMVAHLKNLTDRKQTGIFKVRGKEFNYTIPGNASVDFVVEQTAAASDTMTSAMYQWKLLPSTGEPTSGEWETAFTFVTKCNDQPDWNTIPMLTFPNNSNMTDDLAANYQMAWNRDALFVKVNVTDSQFKTFEEFERDPNNYRQLWSADGCLELYLDCGSNGRANAQQNYDDDDYRYDFAPPAGGKDGRARVWRFVEVDHQLADGVNMPTKQEAAEKIPVNFRRTANGYEYLITLPRRYIEPITLESGNVFSLALFLHDFDGAYGQGHKAISTVTSAGEEAQYHPAIWPQVILR